MAFTSPLDERDLIVCQECDLLCAGRRPTPIERVLKCARCKATLKTYPGASLQAATALLLADLLLLMLMNFNPLVAMQLQGTRRETTLVGAVIQMWTKDMPVISLLVLITTVLAPAFQICIQLKLLYLVGTRQSWASVGGPLRALMQIRPWSMVEILMLAMLVSLVKLQGIADIVLGLALWSCGAFVLVASALTSLISRETVSFWMSRDQH